MKIYNAIKSLLKLKEEISITEIAQIAEVKKKEVLAVIEKNGAGVYHKSNGKITRISFNQSRENLWNTGKFYKICEENPYSRKHIRVNNEAILKELGTEYIDGYYGQHRVNDIKYTSENLKYLHDKGIMEWSPKTDEEYWKE